MASGFQNIGKIPELRKRIFYTITLLAVYRIGAFVTTPGVNRAIMAKIVNQASGTFLGLFNMFSGGALEQMSIFALGIMPYVTSSIVMQLLTVVVPKLDQLNKEGEAGRARINQLTRYGTILVASVQGWFIATYVEGLSKGGAEVVAHPGLAFRLLTVLTLTTGTVVIMWLGELITDQGIGNGSSLIIFAGIVAAMPDGITRFLAGGTGASVGGLTVLFMVLLVIGTIAAICYFERAHRRIPVQYTKRQVGRKMYSGAQSYLPLKINVAGVIPPIFASSILMFPNQIANMSGSRWMQEFAGVLHPADWRYNVIFTVLNVFFAFFYTSVVFNPVDVADNLRKSGGFIPGIRPGKNTAQYIERVLSRITFAGALYLSVVCMIPALLQKYLSVPFQFGGTGLLIVVGVALDTVQQIESHLITRNYEGFSGGGKAGPRIRGRIAARPR